MMDFQVLVLDDDKYMFEYIKTLLAELECIVEWARTGQIAAEKLHYIKFDLVIVDFRLPDCDGMSWMSDRRKEGCETPFIFLSGIPMKFRYQTRLRNILKVESVLQKPIEPAKFIQLVKIVFEQSHPELKTDDGRKVQIDEQDAEYSRPEDIASNSPIQFDIKSCLQSMALDSEDSFEIDEEPDEEFGEETGEEPGEELDEGLGEELSEELDEEIYQLKLGYLEDLPTLLKDLADKLDEASRNGWTQEHIYSAMLAAHSIKGTSATLSIEMIPEVFGCIEQTLKDLHENILNSESKNETMVL